MYIPFTINHQINRFPAIHFSINIFNRLLQSGLNSPENMTAAPLKVPVLFDVIIQIYEAILGTSVQARVVSDSHHPHLFAVLFCSQHLIEVFRDFNGPRSTRFIIFYFWRPSIVELAHSPLNGLPNHTYIDSHPPSPGLIQCLKHLEPLLRPLEYLFLPVNPVTLFLLVAIWVRVYLEIWGDI